VSTIVCQTVQRDAGDQQAMKHLVNVSNDNRFQYLFPATISKDSADAKRYSSKSWNGRSAVFTPILHIGDAMISCTCVQLFVRISHSRSHCLVDAGIGYHTNCSVNLHLLCIRSSSSDVISLL